MFDSLTRLVVFITFCLAIAYPVASFSESLTTHMSSLDPKTIEVIKRMPAPDPPWREGHITPSPPQDPMVIEPMDLDRWIDPVTITGHLLTMLQGVKVPNISVMAYREGKLRPIPFQIDENVKRGVKIFTGGESANPQDSNGFINREDEIMLMAHDLGHKVDKQAWPSESLKGFEVEVSDPVTGGRGWCYIFCFTTSKNYRSDDIYTFFDHQASLHLSTCYEGWTLTTFEDGQRYDKIFYKAFNSRKQAGGRGEDYIDTMRYRAEFRILFGWLSFRFNEKETTGGTLCWINGPIRHTRRVWAQTRLPLNLKSPRFVSDVVGYETLFCCPVRLHVPINPGIILTDFQMTFGTDRSPAARGMRFYNSNNQEGFIADGQMSPAEKAMDHQRDEWRCVTGPQGTIINRSVWDKKYLEQAEVKVLWEDDETVLRPPENIPGEFGGDYVNSIVKSLPPGDYNTYLEWYFPPFFYNPTQPEEFNEDVLKACLNYHDNPLDIRIGVFRGENETYPSPPVKLK